MKQKNDRILSQMREISFFRIATKVNALETFGDMYSDAEKEKIGKDKEVYAYTNEGNITPENWNDLKYEFVTQRLSKYKTSYTLEEKIGRELELLDTYNFKVDDHTILKNRYKAHLENIKTNHNPKSFEFTNNFDKVPEDEVYKYFYQKLVEDNMLTETEFHQYLKVAFEKVEKPKKKFVLKNSKTRGRTTKIFNDYSKDIAGRASGDLKKYVGLLGDYFEGYENNKTLYSNFNK